jgi:Fe-S cluster assembly protein SufD
MAEIHPMKTAAETALAEAYGTLRDTLPGGGEALALRDGAIAAFREAGLPHRRVEAWRYTDLRALMREARPLAPAPDSVALDKARLPSPVIRDHAHLRLTIVDGSFAPSLSDIGLLPAGVRVTTLAEALALGDPTVLERLGAPRPDNAALSLNAAFMTDGVVLTVDAGVAVELPVLLQSVHTGSGHATYTRSLVLMGEGASLTLVEAYEGEAGAGDQTNAVVEADLAKGARLDRIAVQTESYEALHLSTLVATLGEGAELNAFGFAAGAAVARSQLFVAYRGEGARALISGATMLAGKRHADTTLVVDHAVPGGESREMFNAVVDGEARSVFQGKIIVRPHAQKTDGRMMSRSLLLAEGAEAYNKPELEIFADDVQCAHGATCGELDEDLLFHCRARGIPEAEAQAILVQAFLGEAIETVGSEALRDGLTAMAAAWLAERR